MLIQFLIIAFTFVGHADSKSKDPNLFIANSGKKHEFQCPMKSFVVGFLMNKERVYCRKFNEPAKKRSSKICKWKTRCYKSNKANSKDFRIARGLRYVVNKRRNKMAKKQVKLYCCKQGCTSFDCKLKLFRKPVIGAQLKKIDFINKVIHEKRKTVVKAELCRPKCPAIGGPGGGITGGVVGGVLGGVLGAIPGAPTCADYADGCTVDADCCFGAACETGFCGE